MDAPLYTISKAELAPRRDQLVAGVYVLYKKGKPVYIGQSYRTYGRIYQHLQRGIDFDSWRLLPIDDDALRYFTEQALIWALNPDGNAASAIRQATLSCIKAIKAPRNDELTSQQDVEAMQQIILQKTGDFFVFGRLNAQGPHSPNGG